MKQFKTVNSYIFKTVKLTAKAGAYWGEVLLDNETVQSIPLPVEKGS
jgi:hypothetical protein